MVATAMAVSVPCEEEKARASIRVSGGLSRQACGGRSRYHLTWESGENYGGRMLHETAQFSQDNFHYDDMLPKMAFLGHITHSISNRRLPWTPTRTKYIMFRTKETTCQS